MPLSDSITRGPQPDIVLLHIGTNDYLGGWTTHGPWHGPGGDWDQRVGLSAKNVTIRIRTTSHNQ